MRQFITIIQWILGIILCLASFGGFAQGDYLLASFILVIGLLILPPITRKITSKRRTASDTFSFSTQDNVAVSNNAVKEGSFFGWFKGWGTAIKVARALDGSIKSFPNVNPNKVDTLIATQPKWSAKDIAVVKQRIINGYHKKINYENVDVLGEKYLDFYKTIFPSDAGIEIQSKINSDKVEKYLFERVSDDDALDPTEVNEIITYSKSLNVSEFDSLEKIRRDYDYYITNWELAHGVFKGIPSDFVLNKNEACIYKSNCELLEKKTVTKRINYGGGSYRIKIAKGLSYNVGSYRVSSTKETIDVSKGRGVLNVTTKRILFKSGEGVTTINNSAIADIEPYKDAVLIYKTTGKPLTLKVDDGIRLYQYIRVSTRNH